MLEDWADSCDDPIDDQPTNILRQSLWNNKYILLDIEYLKGIIIRKVVLFVNDLWEKAQNSGLKMEDHFVWLGVINAIPKK